MEIERNQKKAVAWRRLRETYGVVKSNTEPNRMSGRDKRLCPVDELPLKLMDIEGTAIDFCGVCGGIWFDSGELRRLLGAELDKERLATELRQQEKSYLRDEVDLPDKDCPVCGHNMIKRMNHEAEILVDHCPQCRGLWLDGGEFAGLYFAAQSNKNDPDTLKKLASEIFCYYA